MEELFVFWLKVYAIDGARYLFGAGTVSFILLVVFRRFSARRKIQSRSAQPSDVRRELFYSMITVGIYATVALATIRLEQAGFLHYYDDWAEYPMLYNLLSLPLILVLHDAYFYWAHRLMHHRRLFRVFHAVHHKSRTPTPWAAYAFAPGEAFLMALFVPLAAFIFPVHVAVLGAFLLIMILRNAAGHSGVEYHPQSWVDGPWDFLTSVTHHDLHHQRVRGNYGLYFTWWDRWMGTEFSDYKECFHEAVGQKAPAPATPEPVPAR
ncbi:MAG: sterol desaturase family protein [Halioglobus sp.]